MMHAPAGDEPLDIPTFRTRIRKMTDEHLLRCGRAAAYMASPAASYGPVRVHSAVGAEWRRRKNQAGVQYWTA
jgi:hypothetical protein